MKELFTSIKPGNKLLAEHIQYYYFQQTRSKGKTYKVMYYPHYVTALNFYKNADVEWDETGRTIQETNEEKITCLFTCNAKISRTVSMIGQHDKIGIIFNPLGINHFIHTHLHKLSKEVISPFDYFGDSFIRLAGELYDEPDLNKKRALLDSYFLSRYAGFQDVVFKKLIHTIVEANSNLVVDEIAEKLNINRKTLLRTFKKHLCCTPREFKSLLKFRKALHQYQDDQIKPKLTHLAYDNQYYDQSDFIKHCKGLVGLAPKQLFAKLKELGDHGTYWTQM